MDILQDAMDAKIDVISFDQTRPDPTTNASPAPVAHSRMAQSTHVDCKIDVLFPPILLPPAVVEAP